MHATKVRLSDRGSLSTEAGSAAPFRGAGVLSKAAWAEVARSLGLSVRELQIAQGVFDDATEENIAAGLGISPHTVHSHLRRLHRKLNVRTRAQLVVRVVASLVTDESPLQTGRRAVHIHPREVAVTPARPAP